MTIYTNDMKSYGMRNGVADFLGMPRENVRVVWMEGPQAYGRTAADDAGFEAAYIAKEIGRPVRVQWMRARRDRMGYEGARRSRSNCAALWTTKGTLRRSITTPRLPITAISDTTKPIPS